MDQATKDSAQREISELADTCFPGTVQGVVVLAHGDDPAVEPGELTARVLIKPEGPDGRPRRLREFEQAHRPEIEQLRRHVSQRLPRVKRLALGCEEGGGRKTILVALDRGRGSAADGQPDGPAADDLTPVMARLGPAELEIVDTLISAGIAANRAEAVRWALARTSERPAYRQLREWTDQIERLKTELLWWVIRSGWVRCRRWEALS
jgi:hypothetical protein